MNQSANQSAEGRVLQRFHELLSSGDLGRIVITTRIPTGTPGERRAEQELSIAGTRHVRARTVSTAPHGNAATSELSDAEIRSLFGLIDTAVRMLVPRSRARFVPDSVLGSITIEVDGEPATFFYLADVEQREAQGHAMSPQMTEALEKLTRLFRDVAQRSGG